MNASVAIQVLPTLPDKELVPVVDKVIEYIQSQGLKTVVSPFETTIEGDYDKLMEILDDEVYSTYLLKNEDTVEVISFVGGG